MVLLKGPLTAVADARRGAAPDVLLAAAGVPALATAGSGDVLSGIIGAFCARGLAAARGGGARRATSTAGRRRSGPPEGLVAGDLPALVARVLSGLETAPADAATTAGG